MAFAERHMSIAAQLTPQANKQTNSHSCTKKSTSPRRAKCLKEFSENYADCVSRASELGSGAPIVNYLIQKTSKQTFYTFVLFSCFSRGHRTWHCYSGVLYAEMCGVSLLLPFHGWLKHYLWRCGLWSPSSLLCCRRRSSDRRACNDKSACFLAHLWVSWFCCCL